MSNPFVPLVWFFLGQLAACAGLSALALCRSASWADRDDE